jgi:hypothetical protein
MNVGRAIFVVVLACALATGCGRTSRNDSAGRSDSRVDRQLAPERLVELREGLAAAILIDVSGSMKDSVAGLEDILEPKIQIAQRAARDLVQQFARYAEEHPEEPTLLGIYEFSQRRGMPDCREVVPMGVPDPAVAASALSSLRPVGGTPIGNAMIAGKRALDATGLTRRHLLVITDGENTDGFQPGRVAAAIGRRPEAERPSIYFVAFDIEAGRFDAVRDAGGLVLGAADAPELNATLDTLLRGRILVER